MDLSGDGLGRKFRAYASRFGSQVSLRASLQKLSGKFSHQHAGNAGRRRCGMKLDLKSFQETAARDIICELDDALTSAAKGKLQAVILAAPTGSGKTITLAQVIDFTFGGGDGISARPETVFLWLSDSPELNVQSKNKLLSACDELPYHKIVTIDSENFKDDVLHSGHVY